MTRHLSIFKHQPFAVSSGYSIVKVTVCTKMWGHLNYMDLCSEIFEAVMVMVLKILVLRNVMICSTLEVYFRPLSWSTFLCIHFSCSLTCLFFLCVVSCSRKQSPSGNSEFHPLADDLFINTHQILVHFMWLGNYKILNSVSVGTAHEIHWSQQKLIA